MNKTKSQAREKKISSNTAKQAREAVLESMFDDMYRKRWKVYRFNFARGIFFGLGSALGGTVVLAFIVWVASSWFIDWPLVNEVIESLQKP